MKGISKRELSNAINEALDEVFAGKDAYLHSDQISELLTHSELLTQFMPLLCDKINAAGYKAEIRDKKAIALEKPSDFGYVLSPWLLEPVLVNCALSKD